MFFLDVFIILAGKVKTKTSRFQIASIWKLSTARIVDEHHVHAAPFLRLTHVDFQGIYIII